MSIFVLEDFWKVTMHALPFTVATDVLTPGLFPAPRPRAGPVRARSWGAVVRIACGCLAALNFAFHAHAQCEQWNSQFGGATLGIQVSTMLAFDPDGDGPQGASLLVSGSGVVPGPVGVTTGVARWTGATWERLGDPFVGSLFNPQILCMTTWDSDGDGPLPPQLVVGGYFVSAGGVTLNSVAKWDGVAWRPLGNGIPTSSTIQVRSLVSWDPDGAGPVPPLLAAGGVFSAIGSLRVNGVAAWDGTSWRALAQGVDGDGSALTVWDRDGDGAEPPRLVVGGGFVSASGVAANHVAMWNGTGWESMGLGVNGQVNNLIVWDSDGAGPLLPSPVACGLFGLPTEAGQNLARWSGTAWSRIGTSSSFFGPLATVAKWDPDGAGPQPERLVAGGNVFGDSGERVAARWFDGTSWRIFGTGLSRTITCLATWDPDGAGIAAPQLFAGGTFALSPGDNRGFVATWSMLPPEVTQSPVAATRCPGQSASFGVTASYASSYQWRRDGTPLVNSTRISGVSTTVLTVAGLIGADAGSYDCVISNICGAATTAAAPLLVCVADMNDAADSGSCDGGVTSEDLLYFLSVFETGDLRSDIDDGSGSGTPDGGVTIDDLLYFLIRYEAGC